MRQHTTLSRGHESRGLLRSVEPECESPDQLLRSRVSVRPSPPLHSPLPSGMGACLHEPATPSFGTALFVAPQIEREPPSRPRRPFEAARVRCQDKTALNALLRVLAGLVVIARGVAFQLMEKRAGD
jgi:hypothetical protein